MHIFIGTCKIVLNEFYTLHNSWQIVFLNKTLKKLKFQNLWFVCDYLHKYIDNCLMKDNQGLNNSHQFNKEALCFDTLRVNK